MDERALRMPAYHAAVRAESRPLAHSALGVTGLTKRKAMTSTQTDVSLAAECCQSDPAFAAWARGYGVIECADATQVRVPELAQSLVRRGRASVLDVPHKRLLEPKEVAALEGRGDVVMTPPTPARSAT
jgi:hypothetical protein